MVKTTIAQTSRRVRCPIEPEVLLAYLQNELPIDHVRAVHAHIQTCDECSARLEQLRQAYEHVGSLNDVPIVPAAGLHETVLRDSHGRLRAVRMARGLNLPGRSVLLLATGALVALILFIAIIARPMLQNSLLAARPSQNTLTHLAPVGAGTFFAETVKLVPVHVSGADWYVGEIIAIDEHSGHVVHTLPIGKSSPIFPQLGIGSGANVPPALSPDGKLLVEAAIVADGRSPTAFAAIDIASRQVKYIAHLALPVSATTQTDPIVRQLWISHDGTTVYVLTDLVANGQRGSHILQFDLHSGQQRDIVIPPLDTASAQTTLAGLVTVLTPDSTALYDARPAVDSQNHQGALITGVRLGNQPNVSDLFIPGAIGTLALAVSPDSKSLFLLSSNKATLYFISLVTHAVVATVTLAPSDARQSNAVDISLALNVAPGGQQLFVVRDMTGSNVQRDFSLWGVNVPQQVFSSLTRFDQPVGQLAYTSDGSHLVVLRQNGQLQTVDIQAPGAPIPWVILGNSATVTQMAGGFVPPAVP